MYYTHTHHNHECDHELAYCNKCDVAYCKKCGKEWKNTTWIYPYNWVYTGSGTNTYTTYTNVPSVTSNVSFCSHTDENRSVG